jgi:hypothetical protein
MADLNNTRASMDAKLAAASQAHARTNLRSMTPDEARNFD